MTDNNQITNWEQFQELIASRAYGSPSEVAHFFRGEANSGYTLEPSLRRRAASLLEFKSDTARSELLKIERYLVGQFISQAELHAHPTEISARNDTLGWWAVMQHYGAPTRLLDWTLSPYVALYFAVQKDFKKAGAIRVLDFYKLSEYSKTISKEDPLKMDIEERNMFFDVMQEKSYIFAYWRTRQAARMVAQQHAFTVSTDVLTDYDESLPKDLERSCLTKYVIPAESKKSFLYSLWRMNVTSNALFPGIDGLGRHIAELGDLALAAAVGEVG